MDVLAGGDIVNVNLGGTGSYQPSAGIEIVLLTPLGNTGNYGFTNGVTNTYLYLEVGNGGGNPLMQKLGITNGQYFYTSTAVAYSGISGIQIK